ncbi:accessory gene regulator B family protein [Lutibacter sp. B2]|nr:accessory gene regulator B family protein [Lutibacter sp. B2]
MENLAQNITNLIVKNNSNLTDLQILKIKFGLECILGESSKFIAYLIIFSIFSLTKFFIIASFFFCSLRVVAGGYHEDTYWRCFFTSFFIFLICITIGVKIDLPIPIRIILFILSILLVWFYAPVDHPNKPILSDIRRKKLKYVSFLVIIFLGIISFFLPSEQAITAIVSLFIQALLLPIGILSQRRIENANFKG